MAQQVTLGGDRLGSGNKQKIELHNYEMSSFNQEQDWKSSMAPGILYPFLKLIGTNHGTFDIDLDSFVRTIPTKGPLFGSFKLQLDIFSCPVRLYQGILHNNPLNIGLKMNQVYLPKFKIKTFDNINAKIPKGSNKYTRQISTSSLIKYLGMSGIGSNAEYNNQTGTIQTQSIERKINAVPILAYYDIFKCYYSNKQEQYAYVITPGEIANITTKINTITLKQLNETTGQYTEKTQSYNNQEDLNIETSNITNLTYTIEGEDLSYNNIEVFAVSDQDNEYYKGTLQELINKNWVFYGITNQTGSWKENETKIYWAFNNNGDEGIKEEIESLGETLAYIKFTPTNTENVTSSIKLTPFELENIDIMRNRLLSNNTLGQEFVIGPNYDLLPYASITNVTNAGTSWNAFSQNGLVVKTYQSDLFNNWLDTEWIDGVDGIAAISSVAVQDGKFTMDSLNLAEKIYKLLNRVAVSGGTYEDWQEAVYGEGAVRKAETPMYMGGMSAEIMFEEVISSSEVSQEQPLGTLAGKGTQINKNGGNNIHIKCEEPTYIIGIASLTPRICYTQGNDWDLTELDTLNDLHKPQLDGIGFQDLIVEQMAWWDTVIRSGVGIVKRSSAGKQTAWINYQTAVDKAYGDFAEQDGKSFMVLSRNYEMEEGEQTEISNTVKDLTTYIDPAKYNYAFAYTDLAAQNFWVQIHSKVISRRKMGAQQIPNI